MEQKGNTIVDCGDEAVFESVARCRIGYGGPIRLVVEILMSAIDRQRIGAVKALQALGYSFDGFVWNAPVGGVALPNLLDEADAMLGLLILRADKIEGCTEGSDEETELKMIADTIETYEAKRWPSGRVAGGKG
jgi:hypothetical protein